jgi:hypothetical protein
VAPSLLNATLITAAWVAPGRVTGSPGRPGRLMSHSCASGPDALARVVPSGLNATAVTWACPSIWVSVLAATRPPAAVIRASRIVPSSLPAASSVPSRLNASARTGASCPLR